MFDLPEPFGPTTTQTPGSNSSVVLSAKDLKPFSVNDLRNTRGPLPETFVAHGDARERGAPPGGTRPRQRTAKPVLVRPSTVP